MKRRRSHFAKGFTLLEVLIASVLLGAVFVAAMALMSRSLQNIERMSVHELVLLHAREKMTELLLHEELAPESLAGEWNDGFRWQVEIAPYQTVNPGQPAAYGLFRVRLTILWGGRESVRTYVVETTQWARRASSPTTP